MSTLFSSYTLGNLTLANRVVMAPMTRNRADHDYAPTDLVATYYAQRAAAGLIITEGVAPSPNGLGYPRTPGIYSEKQIKQWRRVTDAVHEKDGRIFLQIMHVGRVANSLNTPEGAQVLAPSAVELSGEMYTDAKGMQPHTPAKEMTIEEVRLTVQEFIDAAKNAVEAGFDGVEIHGANGYVIEQFINPNTNKREDEYGGSTENRTRFLVEIAEGIVAAIGKDKVGIRVSPYGVFNEMAPYDSIDADYTHISAEMKRLDIAYMHVVDHEAMGAPAVSPETKQAIRDTFGGTVILSGGYEDAKRANENLDAGLGHLVAYGRPFLANPDLVTRLKQGAELNAPDYDTFYTPGEKGYTDYPTL